MGFLRRLHAVGANPLLLAQNYQQMCDGAGTYTPLEITAETDGLDTSKRKAWRERYVQVFGLGQLNSGVRGGAPPPPPAVEPEPEPAEGQPPVADFKPLICEESGAYTQMPVQPY